MVPWGVFLLAPPPGQGRAVYAHARPDAAAWLLAAPSGGMQESDRGGAAGDPGECVAGAEERERREWAGLEGVAGTFRVGGAMLTWILAGGVDASKSGKIVLFFSLFCFFRNCNSKSVI